MIDFGNHIKKENVHHAYLIEGFPEEIVPVLEAHLIDLGFFGRGHPDFWLEIFENFSIDAARALCARANIASEQGGKKFFVIGAFSFSREAENALLKSLEEPTANTHFFIITPKPEFLLPTLRSRAVVISGEKNIPSGAVLKEAQDFMKSDFKTRFAFSENFVAKHKKDEESGSSVRARASRFLDALEYEVHQATVKEGTFANPEIKFLFDEILMCKSYLSSSGSSVKMILDHIGIATPSH